MIVDVVPARAGMNRRNVRAAERSRLITPGCTQAQRLAGLISRIWFIVDRQMTNSRSSPYVGSQQALQFTAPPFGSNLSGIVYNDFNRNGRQDAGEPGLAGWQVYLDLKRDGTLDPGDPVTTTDVNGNYTVSGLADGSYTATAFPPGGTSLLQNSISNLVIVGANTLTGQDIVLQGPAPLPGGVAAQGGRSA